MMYERLYNANQSSVHSHGPFQLIHVNELNLQTSPLSAILDTEV